MADDLGTFRNEQPLFLCPTAAKLRFRQSGKYIQFRGGQIF
jgi:hypothetical protein